MAQTYNNPRLSHFYFTIGESGLGKGGSTTKRKYTCHMKSDKIYFDLSWEMCQNSVE